MAEYKPQEIEKKWQKYWADNKIFKTENKSSKPKYYVLDMFPYPSGAGLHVGHPLGYIATDIVARYKRLKGYNVLHPMGYDAFGLPAEQYAIQTGQHPAVTTEKNIARYREQLDNIGFSYDWDREVRTSDPSYYKWTQWIFIKLFNHWYNKTSDKAEPIETLTAIFEKEGNAKVKAVCDEDTPKFSAQDWNGWSEVEKYKITLKYRLAYLANTYVNWCPGLGTVLANEEVKDGVSERGGFPVIRKEMPQWNLRITAYAERLLNDLDTVDWPEPIKEQQRYWIGKSKGCMLRFKIASSPGPFSFGEGGRVPMNIGTEGSGEAFIEVFTTRVDTIYGVTYLTLAPEHELIEKITTPAQKEKVEKYVNYAKNRSERDRMSDVKTISGEFTGAYAVNPLNGALIPIWIGEYVLAGYGTGAVMAVPSSDTRDYAFARHFNLPIIAVQEGPQTDISKEDFDPKAGTMINSDFLNGMTVPQALEAMTKKVEDLGVGYGKINFKVRDSIFSRQRYWGEPFPVYYKEGLPYVLPESELPLKLPDIDQYKPTESGEPPLARAKDWEYKEPHPNALSRSETLVSSVLRGGNAVPQYFTGDPNVFHKLKEISRIYRKEPTKAEDLLWQHLRNDQTGFTIRRQHVIGIFIVDFVCLDKKLVIEADGEIHENEDQRYYDEERTKYLESEGYEVIRFKNEEILTDIFEIKNKIKARLKERNTDQLDSLPPAEGRGGAKEAYPLETNTMPGWAGSSWYFLRYMDPKNPDAFASQEAIDYWQDVDLYLGGSEHATGHLLYSRFWHKFLYDLGFVKTKEYAKKLINQGMIQGVSQYIFITEFHLINNEENKTDIPEIYIHSYDSYENDKNERWKNFVEKYKSNEFDKVQNLLELAIPIQYVDEKGRIDSSNLKKLSESMVYFKSRNIDLEKNIIWEEEKGVKFIRPKPLVEKMSKRLGNVVNPDEVVEKYGTDTLRLYEMFLGPLELSKPWNTNSISGVSRFLRNVWKLFYDDKGNWLVTNEAPTKDELKTLHKTIKKVEEDIDRFSFNTSVSTFMVCVNELTDLKCHKKAILQDFLIVLAPYAPHIVEELWEHMDQHFGTLTSSPSGKAGMGLSSFPQWKEEYLVENSFEYPVSVNGKLRFKMEFSLDTKPQDIEKEVLAANEMQKWLEGKQPKKVIVVPGKIVNVVV